MLTIIYANELSPGIYTVPDYLAEITGKSLVDHYTKEGNDHTITTNTENLIYGIRLAVKERKSAEGVCIFYKNKDGKLLPVFIDDTGYVDYIEPGFCRFVDHMLEELTDWNRNDLSNLLAKPQ